MVIGRAPEAVAATLGLVQLVEPDVEACCIVVVHDLSSSGEHPQPTLGGSQHYCWVNRLEMLTKGGAEAPLVWRSVLTLDQAVGHDV